MPYRVPGGNLVGRIIGLGNLDKLEREREMRRAYKMYDRPIHAETEQRIRQRFNDRRDPLRMPPSRYPHHEPFIPDGLTPNMNQRRRHFEPWGLHYPHPGLEPPVRSPYQLDVDDWSDERIINYYDDHSEGIARFKNMKRRRYLDGRRFSDRSMRWWVRNYHEYILDLQRRDELRFDHPRNGRGRGLEGGWRDDDPYHGGYGRRPRHMDEEDEEDEED